MKKQDSVGIGCSLIVTLTFVVIEIILFQMSSSWNLILLFPIFGIGYGLYLTIKAYLKQSRPYKIQKPILSNMTVLLAKKN